MIQPKEITVKTQDGVEKNYIISKFPAIQGREIIAKNPLSAMPKLGDYEVNEETMLKLMCFVAVPNGTDTLALSTRALVDNHFPDWETLARVEVAMMEYNVSFLKGDILKSIMDKVTGKIPSIMSKILTSLSPQSSGKKSPRSKS
jgi:hypothetical protein